MDQPLSEEVHRAVDETYPGWHGWVSRDGDKAGWIYAVTQNGLAPGQAATVSARTPQQIGGAIEEFLRHRDRLAAPSSFAPVLRSGGARGMSATTGHAEATGSQRDAYIKGLEDFAAFLRDNPGVPVWRHGQEFLFHPDDGEAGVRRLAVALGTEAEERPQAHRATIRFGPHSYVAYAPKGEQQAGAR